MSNIKVSNDWLIYTSLVNNVREVLLANPGCLINVEELLKDSNSMVGYFDTRVISKNTVLNVSINDDNIAICQGTPIYLRLPGECESAYKLFTIYRDLPKQGEPRIVYNVAKQTGTTPLDLENLKIVFAWDVRCKASDNAEAIKKDIALSHKKMELELTTLSELELIYSKCQEALMQQIDTLPPKDVIALLKYTGAERSKILDGLNSKELEKLPFAKDGEATSEGTETDKRSIALLAQTLGQLGVVEGVKDNE